MVETKERITEQQRKSDLTLLEVTLLALVCVWRSRFLLGAWMCQNAAGRDPHLSMYDPHLCTYITLWAVLKLSVGGLQEVVWRARVVLQFVHTSSDIGWACMCDHRTCIVREGCFKICRYVQAFYKCLGQCRICCNYDTDPQHIVHWLPINYV